jgi:hypothetical protein
MRTTWSPARPPHPFRSHGFLASFTQHPRRGAAGGSSAQDRAFIGKQSMRMSVLKGSWPGGRQERVRLHSRSGCARGRSHRYVLTTLLTCDGTAASTVADFGAGVARSGAGSRGGWSSGRQRGEDDGYPRLQSAVSSLPRIARLAASVFSSEVSISSVARWRACVTKSGSPLASRPASAARLMSTL